MPAIKRERVSVSPGAPKIYEEVQTATIPPPAQTPSFPYIPPNILNPLLLVILNLSISSASTALAAQYIGDEIGNVQKETPEEYWWYVVPGWRVLKALAIWWGGFGALDTSLLAFLSLAPTTHFLTTFHPSLSAYAHASTITISTLSSTLPMYLLRSEVSDHHHHHHYHKKHHRRATPDKSTYITIGLLASSIYASVMYTSLKTFLTRAIVSYFPSMGLRSGLVESVQRVYHPTPTSWGLTLPIGFAMAELVFQKSIQLPTLDPDVEAEDRGLLQRIWDWLGPRGTAMVKRTLWVAGYMGVDTIVRLAGVAKGGSLEGASAVGGVWIFATLLVGAVFGWIGKE